MLPPGIIAYFFLFLSSLLESSPFSFAISLLFILSSVKYDLASAPTNPQKPLIKAINDFLGAKVSGQLVLSYSTSLRYLASLFALLFEIFFSNFL